MHDGLEDFPKELYQLAIKTDIQFMEDYKKFKANMPKDLNPYTRKQV